MPAGTAVSIRAAESADAFAIAAVIRAAFEPYRDRLVPTPSALSETAESIGVRLGAGQGFMAEAERRIVGCVLMQLNSPDDLYVGRLAVIPELQGRGLARRLMERAEAFARADGCTQMSLGVRIALTGNIAFFERCGFRFVSAERHPGFIEPTYILMRKEL
jgi:predicted N-acetyltransferase YhbS